MSIRSVSFWKGRNDDIRLTLTAREVEVLRLVAEGCTNPEISQILAISSHTVKSHMVHIFNKLGVDSRAAAVATAGRQGLLPGFD